MVQTCDNGAGSLSKADDRMDGFIVPVSRLDIPYRHDVSVGARRSKHHTAPHSFHDIVVVV